MATLSETLQGLSSNMEESMGARQNPVRSRAVPTAQPRDIGRRPVRNVCRIAIDQVIPDPEQPRQEFPCEALKQLADSIRDKGQLSPIRVRWSDSRNKWVIVFGERRWQAAQLAGLNEVECTFVDDELPRSEILELQLIENCLREDLQPIEEANAFAALMQLNNWTGSQLAEALHVSPSRVSRSLALLKLPPDVQRKIADGLIPERTAYELSKLGTESAMRNLAGRAADGRLTTKQAASVIRQRRGKPRRKARSVRQTFVSDSGWKICATANGNVSYHDLEAALSEALVEVRHRTANGLRLF